MTTLVIATLISAFALCIPANTHAVLAADQVVPLYQRCAPALAADIPGLTLAEQAAVFGTLVSYRAAPYGPEPSGCPPCSWDYATMVASPTLACDNYAALAFEVARQVDPTLTGTVGGFDHGPFGNHAQLFVGRLLLDPTVGLVAYGALPDLVAGRPGLLLARWRSRDDLAGFEAEVVGAVLDGGYDRTTVLYMLPLGWVPTVPTTGLTRRVLGDGAS